MHRLLPLSMAAALGVVAGVLLGEYWGHGGPLTLSVALVGLGLTTAAPVVLWTREEHRDRTRADETAERERRARYDAHAQQLTEQAIRPLRTLRLATDDLVPDTGPGGMSGLTVNEGEETRRVDELPNWPYALEHLQTDPDVGPLWGSTETAVREYCALRAGLAEELAGRYTHLLLARYGFETHLDGRRFDPPPWFDARALVGLALAVRGPLDRSTVTVVPAMIDARVDADPMAPHLVLIGETPVAGASRRDAANPAEVADLFELGRSGSAAAASLRSLAHAEARARRAIRQMADASRRYADRMAIEHAGSGACAVCRPWLAASPDPVRAPVEVGIERA